MRGRREEPRNKGWRVEGAWEGQHSDRTCKVEGKTIKEVMPRLISDLRLDENSIEMKPY